MARSRVFPVWLKSPWVIITSLAVDLVPSPICNPAEVVDVLEDMPKRAALSQMTDWQTLPKVFINGQFYGDTDILEPMAEKGELQKLLDETFAGRGVAPAIKLH